MHNKPEIKPSTKPEVKPEVKTGVQATPRRSARRSSRLADTFRFLFRLGLLGVGASLAWGIGMGIAMFRPAPAQQSLPWLEQLRHLRERVPVAQPRASSPELLRTQLAQLRGEHEALSRHTAELEQQLGNRSPVTGSLEGRLSALDQQLKAGATAVEEAEPGPNSPLPADAIQLSLASEPLFEANQRQLRANALNLLGVAIASLKAHPGATVLITSYADGPGDVLARAYGQAQAVQAALSQHLGTEVYTWVPVGIEAEQTGAAAARSRRIEIAILP